MKPVPKPQAFAWFATLTLMSLLIGAYAARAGTYNFYFNNTEQGDNSTATPQVSVVDGKGTGGQMGPKDLTKPQPQDPIKAKDSLPAEATIAGSTPETVTASPSSQSVAQAPVLETPTKAREFRLLRLMVTGGGMSQSLHYSDSSTYGDKQYSHDYNSFSNIGPIGLLNLGINISNRTTINGFAGLNYINRSVRGVDSLAGLELETRPLHLSLFGREDLFEAGIILGASTLAKAPGNMVSAHAGLRININFTNDLGITVAGRGNLGYVMADAGLTFRL